MDLVKLLNHGPFLLTKRSAKLCYGIRTLLYSKKGNKAIGLILFK